MRKEQDAKSWKEWRCTEMHGAENAHDVAGWLDAAEKVWIDLLGEEGDKAARRAGRSRGPRLVWKTALGPPADPMAFATRASRSWAKLSAWMQIIKTAMTHRGAQEQAAHPLNRSANVARRRILAAKRWRMPREDQQQRLAAFVNTVRWQDLRCIDKVAALCEWALAESRKECAKKAYDSTRQYIEWLRGGQANGLARQHKATKQASQWVPHRMIKSREDQEDRGGEGADEERSGTDFNWLQSAWDGTTNEVLQTPANLQQVVDGEAAEWARQWAVKEAMEECVWPEELEELEPLTVQQLQQAARTFKTGTGLGWDRIHPHALLRLPTGLLQWLCRILNNAERSGSWEVAIGIVMVVLIPKGEGGLRPIGLLPALVRVWAKARRQVARD